MTYTHFKRIRARLYPTAKQKQYLNELFGCGRFVFNKCLDMSKEYYKQESKSANLKVLGNFFHQNLTKNPENKFLTEHNTKVLKQEAINLLEAYKNFFVNGSGFPKYKSQKDTQTLRFPIDTISKNTFTGRWRINLIKQLQSLKFKLSDKDREYISSGRNIIKSITVIREREGSHWLSILVPHTPIKYKTNDNVVGLDFGIKEFATLSDNSVHKNNRFYVRKQKINKRLQQSFSRKQKGSSNWKKAKTELSRAHSKIKRQRSNYIHNVTAKVVNDNQVIAIESLNISGMLKNHCLAKHIQDVSISEAIRQLRYKCEWRGRDLIEVGRWFPSSKKCSGCGSVKKKLKLSTRTYKCENCGLVIDRDLNASINIREEGLKIKRETLPRCGEDVRPKDLCPEANLCESEKHL